ANIEPITADMALKVALAAGAQFTRGDHRHRVVIGKDTRLSCYMLEYAMTSGFLAAGMDVLLTGPLPTPAIAMLTRAMRADVGVMISASHNPYDDNGIKLFGPDGYKLSDAIEAAIEARMAAGNGTPLPTGSQLVPARRTEVAPGGYMEFVKTSSPSASAWGASRSSSIAPTAPPTRWRRRCCGSSAPRSCPSRSSPTAPTSIATAAPSP